MQERKFVASPADSALASGRSMAVIQQPTTKGCTRCGVMKPLADFSKQDRGYLGLRSRCKTCVATLSREWVLRNPDKAKSATRKWKAANPDRIKSYRREKIENLRKDPEKYSEWRCLRNEQVKRSRCIHLDRVKAREARYREANREKLRERKAQYDLRQRSMRQFFKMHHAMHAIAESINQIKNDDHHAD